MIFDSWKRRWQSLSGQDKNKALGLLFIFAVALIWVLASFIVQEIEGEGLNPFVLTYIANSLFIVLLPINYLTTKLRRRGDRDSPSEAPQEGDSELLIESGLSRRVARLPFSQSQAKQILGAALVVAPIWFSAQWTFNMSLSWTTVTSNTILSSTASLFTYGLAILLLNDTFTWLKLASVLCCILGTAMVTLADEINTEEQHKGSAIGDLLCLLSAFFYASYTIALRSLLKEDDSSKMMLFFGFVGLLNLVALFPILFVLVQASVISISGLTLRLFLLAVAKGLFDNVLSDYLWARAVLLVGPTVATVGLQMQIPIAMVADFLGKRPAWLSRASTALLMVTGTLAILAGFLGVNLGPLAAGAGPREETALKACREDDPADPLEHGSRSPRSRISPPLAP